MISTSRELHQGAIATCADPGMSYLVRGKRYTPQHEP